MSISAWANRVFLFFWEHSFRFLRFHFMGPQVMRNGVFPAISVNQDDTVIKSFQPSRALREGEYTCGLSSVQSLSRVPILWPHELQHTRPPCPSPTPRVHPTSRASSRWCHPAISSSVVPFSSCSQSLPASESFPVSQLFTCGGQSIGVSALVSVLPKNTQDWSPLGWTGWFPCSPRDSQESSPTPQFKSINSSVLSFLYTSSLTSTQYYWKNYSFD